MAGRNPPDQLSPEAVKGILAQPDLTGVGPYPGWSRMRPGSGWHKLIEEEGPEQFLVNLLHVPARELSGGLDP